MPEGLKDKKTKKVQKLPFSLNFVDMGCVSIL